MPNEFPDFLKWMPGAEDILLFETHPGKATGVLKNADLIFTLDFNHFSRVGNDMQPTLEALDTHFIMIDHHQQPADYATVTYSNASMSSTCEMVYHFITALGKIKLLNQDIAHCLYAGIMTDTGSFRFSATTSTTHKIVAHLIDLGAKNHYIHQKVYDTNSPSRLTLLGIALKNMVVLPEHKTAFITLSRQEMEMVDFKKGDTEGFVNYGLGLKGIVFAAIFIENIGEAYIKISFRSKGTFSVNQFARNYFNGGGHDNAAGGRSNTSMEETIAYFKDLLPKHETQLAQSLDQY